MPGSESLTRRLRRCAGAAPALVMGAAMLFSVAVPAAVAQQTERAKSMGKRIRCMCGGCNDAASLCKHSGGSFAGPCDMAQTMLKELDERVARNEPDDLTVQSFIQEYGPEVMLVPEAKGFNFWAWAMPAIVPLVGLSLVWLAVMRWRQRAAVAPKEKVSIEMLARARREAAEDNERW
jgi:cytochrome c-type biogenesis protein CcmH/NrfF